MESIIYSEATLDVRLIYTITLERLPVDHIGYIESTFYLLFVREREAV